ncbi:hypothetical protein DRB17_12825 [Ferruginivarius sediminum]|uniref:Response regulatory domain-containing protein n=2 Tax=Ferruginivarius sediminum TaxID=2661937 RepID=A0A369T7R0_9PROT|nr:hypothetical protein DRB17_12825 [Ferruginivarius sediminum]
MSGPNVYIVSKGRRNAQLMLEVLARQGAAAQAFQSLDDLESAIASNPAPDLVFIDVVGFGKDLWRTCEWLHEHGTAFFVIYPPNQERLEALGSAHGARGTLKKPVSVAVLSKLIQDVSSGSHA